MQLSSHLDKKFNLCCFSHLWSSSTSSSFCGVSVAQDLSLVQENEVSLHQSTSESTYRIHFTSQVHTWMYPSPPLISEKFNCIDGTNYSTFTSSSPNRSFYHFLLEPKLLPHPTGLECSEYQPTGRTCPTCIFLHSLLL